MELTRRQGLIWSGAAFLFVAAAILARLGAFGVWDPWELDVAELAKKLAAGEPPKTPIRLSTWLVALSYQLFGMHEWSGRLPIALSGLAAVAAAYYLVARYAGQRAGIYTGLIAATTPLLLFNSRSMLGDAPALAAQACLGLCAISAVLGPGTGSSGSWKAAAGWLIATALAGWLAVETRGALLGALPPLGAVAVTAAIEGRLLRPRGDPPGAAAGWLIAAATAALIVLIAIDISAEPKEYSLWIGGKLQAGVSPGFDLGFEAIFHSFAPWSVLLPMALAQVLAPAGRRAADLKRDADSVGGSGEERSVGEQASGGANRSAGESALRLALALWILFGYGVHTLFIYRYGNQATFLPLAALAAAVALMLRDVERDNQSFPATAAIAVLLAGLIVRDYALYPGSPVKAMPLGQFDIPKEFNPTEYWEAIMILFAAAAFFGFAVAPGGAKLDLRAPYRLLREQWRRGASFKAWLSALALLLAAAAILGLLTVIAPNALRLTTIAIKWIRRLAFLPAAIPLLVVIVQLTIFAFSKFGNLRLLPMLGVGLCFGVGASQFYMPALSAHFSPRSVYETYDKLGRDSKELIEYRMGVRAAGYYARGKVREIVRQSELVDYLLAPQRRWAVLPTTELAAVDGEFRKRTSRHLFVADARSARVLLVTNQPLGGVTNQNQVAKYVTKEPPRIKYPVKARFEEYIELLGYNMQLTHGDYVGAGESFMLSWYYRVLKRIPGTYRVFVHIDGFGLRLNGDHDPVEGKYAMRLWDQGDIIADVHQLQVPPNFRAGRYTIFMGFFSGDTRLKVVEGPRDDADRVNAGTLQIR